MLDKIRYLLRGGFFSILCSTFINKIIAFITNIFLVRILSKNDYGVFTGSFNVFYIVFVFSGLGITSAMLYFCAKDISRDEKTQYYKYGFRFGLISECFLSMTLLLYGLFGHIGIEETRKYIISFAALPFIAFLFDYWVVVLRAERSNHKYAVLVNLNTVFYAVFGVLGALLGGIGGTIAGRYIAYILAVVIGFFYCKEYINFDNKDRLESAKAKDITRYALKAGITSALNVMLYRIDVFVIGIIIADASVLASYKNGVALPENMSFIPACVMLFFGPILIQNIKNTEWVKRKIRLLYLCMGVVSTIFGVIMFAFAPQLILILWGADYLDAVPCMRILSINSIILATFKTTSVNILLALKRPGFTMAVSVISGITNILLEILLITGYGSIGAAYATLLVTILASTISFIQVMYVVYSGKENYE